MKSIRVIAWVVFLSFIGAPAIKSVFAADKSRISGKYLEIATNSATKIESTLEVDQSDTSIEITATESGKRTTSRCPLDGSEGEYTTPGGIVGKCKAYFKGKFLMIESLILSRPQPGAPAVRIHTMERWQLSADFKILSIRSDVDFPDFPADISGVVAGETSGTRKYTRVGTQ